jgi:ubiquinone/menaquinone biosynthesis C-methylase UbiE/DNA-binding transcriptional ArsR family regulator
MDRLIKALKAAGEPTRLRILAALSQYELTVTELVSLLGQSQPRVSRHLKLLLEAGLVVRFQEGSWVFQRLSESPLTSKITRMINLSDPLLKQDSERLGRIKIQNAKLATDYFAANAGDWDQVRTMVGSDETIEAAMLEMVKGKVFNNMIDMGTGTGRIVEIFAGYADKATGYDSSQEMLKLARTKFEQAGLGHCQARLGDITALPTASGSADLVTIHQVLHYLDSPFAVIEEAKRLLTPDGLILIVDFAKHQHEFLRTEHAHRRLGFADSEIQFWCDNNELRLNCSKIINNNASRDGLEVMLWILEHNN